MWLTSLHTYITWCQINDSRPVMALSGLKPPAPLLLEGNLAQNWKVWYNAYEIYAGATGVTSKSGKVQCFVFLHIAGLEAQKRFETF